MRLKTRSLSTQLYNGLLDLFYYFNYQNPSSFCFLVQIRITKTEMNNGSCSKMMPTLMLGFKLYCANELTILQKKINENIVHSQCTKYN